MSSTTHSANICLALLAAFLALITSAVHAQAPSHGLTFEVASVKRNMDRQLIVSGVTPAAGGRVSAKAATLKDLIQSAYQIKAREIFGGPNWQDSERYDIEAKAADAVDWDSGLRLMLQTLLANRFQLRVHMEQREMSVYALTIGKTPLKLKNAEGDCIRLPNGICGGFVTKIGQMTARKGSLAQLASALSAIMDRPVIDKTGVAELFSDVNLQWVPDETQFGDWGTDAYKRAVSDPLGPSIFTALQEQLGLRLEGQRAPIQVLIVDHAERPSEN